MGAGSTVGFPIETAGLGGLPLLSVRPAVTFSAVEQNIAQRS